MTTEKKTSDYPYVEPRIDEQLYQINIPKLLKASERKKPSNYRSRNSDLLYSPYKLPEYEVTEYINFAKYIYPDIYSFNCETCLNHLHKNDYNIIKAKYSLIEPIINTSFINYKNISLTNEVMELKINEFIKLKTANYEIKKAEFIKSLDTLKKKNVTFDKIQEYINLSAIYDFDTEETRALRKIARIVVLWLKKLQPILSERKCTDATLLPKLIAQADEQFPNIILDEKRQLIEIYNIIQEWEGKVFSIFNNKYDYKYEESGISDSESDSEIKTVNSSPMEIEKNLYADGATSQQVQSIANEGLRNFPGFSSLIVDKLLNGVAFAKNLVDTVVKKVAPQKKTRHNQNEAKLTLFEAEKLFQQYERDYQWMRIPEAKTLYFEISEARRLGTEAVESMKSGKSEKSHVFLAQLEKMQLILPEMEYLSSYHTGIVWSDKAKAMLTSTTPFPKLSAIRFAINEATLLKLSSPPHLEQKSYLSGLVEKGENWQSRAKDAINKKSNITILQDLLNERIYNSMYYFNLVSTLKISVPDENKLLKMIENSKLWEIEVNEWKNKKDRFILSDLQSFFKKFENGEYASITTVSSEELTEMCRIATEWNDNAINLLTKEFPRINHLKQSVEAVISHPVLLRFDFDELLGKLNTLISSFHNKLAEAEIMLNKSSSLDDITALYTVLNRLGAVESDPTFSVLAQRYRESVSWIDGVKKNVPNKNSSSKYTPTYDRIAKLIDQKENSIHLKYIDCPEYSSLVETFNKCQDWKLKARAALDNEDSTLEYLTALLDEGFDFPIRIAEKDTLESKCWAMGWVERGEKMLNNKTDLSNICNLYAELHAFKLDADTIRETEEIPLIENRIKETIAWIDSIRHTFEIAIGKDETWALFGSTISYEFEPLTEKPHVNIALAVDSAKDLAQAELDINDNNDDDIRVKRQRRIVETKKKPIILPNTAEIVQTVGKKRKPKDVIITIAERPLKLFEQKIRISDSQTGVKTIINGNPYVIIILTTNLTKNKSEIETTEDNQNMIIENPVEDKITIRVKKPDYVLPASQKVIKRTIKPNIGLGYSDSVYCICRTSQSEGILMILCESCGEWFHLNCLGLNKLDAAKDFMCWSCVRTENDSRDEIPYYPFAEKYPPKNHSWTGVAYEKLVEFKNSMPLNVDIPEIGILFALIEAADKFILQANSLITQSNFLLFQNLGDSEIWTKSYYADCSSYEFRLLVDKLQELHYSNVSLPITFQERTLLESRIRVANCRSKMEKLKTKKINPRELSQYVSEMQSLGVNMEEDFCKAVSNLNDAVTTWINVVNSLLPVKTDLLYLEEGAIQCKHDFDSLQCPERVELERRVQVGKEFELKLRLAISKRANLSTIMELLKERESVCSLVTTETIIRVEDQVNYLLGWLKLFDHCLNNKSPREDFLKLRDQIIPFCDGYFMPMTEKAMQTIAELKSMPQYNSEFIPLVLLNRRDLDTLSDCCRFFCLCRKPWQNDAVMINCDLCQDWFHFNCVGLPADTAVNLANYSCPRCCKASNIDYPYECVVDNKVDEIDDWVVNESVFQNEEISYNDVPSVSKIVSKSNKMVKEKKPKENKENKPLKEKKLIPDAVEKKERKKYTKKSAITPLSGPIGSVVENGMSAQVLNNPVIVAHDSNLSSTELGLLRRKEEKLAIKAIKKEKKILENQNRHIYRPNSAAPILQNSNSYNVLSQLAAVANGNGTSSPPASDALSQLLYLQMSGATNNSAAAVAMASTLNPSHLPLLLKELHHQQMLLQRHISGEAKEASVSRLFVQDIFLKTSEMFTSIETRATFANCLNDLKDRSFNEALKKDVIFIMCHLAKESNDPRVSPERIAFMVEHIYQFFANTLTYSQSVNETHANDDNLLPKDINDRAQLINNSESFPTLNNNTSSSSISINNTDSSQTPAENPTPMKQVDIAE